MYSKEKFQDILMNLSSIRDYIRWTLSEMNINKVYLGHGSDSVWDEAVNLVLSAINMPYDMPNNMFDSKLLEIEKKIIISYVYQRSFERKPLAYILKKTWFADIEFYVDERVIIPRSPIAELIRNYYSPWIKNIENVNNMLDLCTGSGCIGIASSNVFENADVTLVDISNEAIEVAKHNIAKHSLEDRIKVVQSDLFTNLGNKKFDLIVSNPPYVDINDLASMPSEYNFEPKLALEAGKDGLDLVKKIILGADKYLTKNGILIVEVGNSQYSLVDMCPCIPFTWLSFKEGGDGVFLLTHDELIKYKEHFNNYFKYKI